MNLVRNPLRHFIMLPPAVFIIIVERLAVGVRNNRGIIGGFCPALNLKARHAGFYKLRDMLYHT